MPPQLPREDARIRMHRRGLSRDSFGHASADRAAQHLCVVFAHHVDRSASLRVNGTNCTESLNEFLIKGHNLSAVPLKLPYVTLAQITFSTLKGIVRLFR